MRFRFPHAITLEYITIDFWNLIATITLLNVHFRHTFVKIHLSWTQNKFVATSLCNIKTYINFEQLVCIENCMQQYVHCYWHNHKGVKKWPISNKNKISNGCVFHKPSHNTRWNKYKRYRFTNTIENNLGTSFN